MNRNDSRYFSTAMKMDQAFLARLEKKEYAYITVKEICEKAGVNRSTFYLHYETMEDLLSESTEYMNSQFLEYMKSNRESFMEKMSHGTADDLYLITPQYLEPYLQFIQKNRRLFLTAIRKSQVLRLQESYDALFRHVLNPILERYHVPEGKRKYILSFYVNGIMAVISEWLQNDCRDSIETITEIIEGCVVHPESERKES